MRKLLSTAAAAAALLAAASMPAQARLVITMTDVTGGTSKSCDTAAAISAVNCNLAAGFNFVSFNDVAFSGSVGLFNILSRSGVGVTTNVPGTSFEAKIDQSILQLSNTTAVNRQFTVSVTGFDYTLPTSPFKTLFGSQGMSTSANAGSATATYYADGTNAGLLTNATSCAVVIGTNASCAATPLNWISGATFSLTQVQTFTLIGLQDVNATNNLSARNRIPEPMTTSLVGAALLALALTSARRASKV